MKKLEIDSEFHDRRGSILTFIPDTPILEMTAITSKMGVERGYHYHPEFDEYVLLLRGHGTYYQQDPRTGEDMLSIDLYSGECIYFPANCAHRLECKTDMHMVALLTKPWKECNEPIVHVGRRG